MARFHIYAFRARLDRPEFRLAVVARYDHHTIRDLDPDSFSPGAVEHIVIEARDYGVAKQRGFEFAPLVQEAGGRSVRRK
jgi:hypothetical protein